MCIFAQPSGCFCVLIIFENGWLNHLVSAFFVSCYLHVSHNNTSNIFCVSVANYTKNRANGQLDPCWPRVCIARSQKFANIIVYAASVSFRTMCQMHPKNMQAHVSSCDAQRVFAARARPPLLSSSISFGRFQYCAQAILTLAISHKDTADYVRMAHT